MNWNDPKGQKDYDSVTAMIHDDHTPSCSQEQAGNIHTDLVLSQ